MPETGPDKSDAAITHRLPAKHRRLLAPWFGQLARGRGEPAQVEVARPALRETLEEIERGDYDPPAARAGG